MSMKRMAVTVVGLALMGSVLVGCNSTDDDCDDALTGHGQGSAGMSMTDGRSGGSSGGGSKGGSRKGGSKSKKSGSGSGKSGKHKSHHHDRDDDCDDD